MAVSKEIRKCSPLNCYFHWEIDDFYPDYDLISRYFYLHEKIYVQFYLKAILENRSDRDIEKSAYTFYLYNKNKMDRRIHNLKINYTITIHHTSKQFIKVLSEDYKEYESNINFDLFTVYFRDGSFRINDKIIPYTVPYLKINCHFKIIADNLADIVPTVAVPSIKKSNVCSDLKILYESKEQSDITIVIGCERLKAHRLILMARSPVFKAMLSSNFVENERKIIEISDTDTHVFDCFLKYLYCGEVEESNFDLACSLYAIADKYDVADLKGKCGSILEANLSEETVGEILKLAQVFRNELLKERAVDFVRHNFSKM